MVQYKWRVSTILSSNENNENLSSRNAFQKTLIEVFYVVSPFGQINLHT